MSEQSGIFPDLAFNDRRDHCLNLLSRILEQERVPDGARDWFTLLVFAAESSVRPRLQLAPNGWRHPRWDRRQPRHFTGVVEAQRQAVEDVIVIGLRVAGEPACPAPVMRAIYGWVDEMRQRFNRPVEAETRPLQAAPG
jgi:hypothetical protein